MRKRAVFFGLLFVAATFLFGGCIDNDQSLTVWGAVAPDSSCQYPLEPDTWWARGTLDLAFSENPTYILWVQVRNNMPFNASPENFQLDTMAVRLDKATVTYTWLYGEEDIQRSHAELMLIEDVEETIYMAGTVDSGSESGGDAGTLVTGFEAVPRQVGGQLTGLGSDAEGVVLGLEVVIHGTTLGGTEVTTNQFVFPVYLCWGCLATGISGDDFTYTCCQGGEDEYFPGCIPGQDSVELPCTCN